MGFPLYRHGAILLHCFFATEKRRRIPIIRQDSVLQGSTLGIRSMPCPKITEDYRQGLLVRRTIIARLSVFPASRSAGFSLNKADQRGAFRVSMKLSGSHHPRLAEVHKQHEF